MVAPPDGTWSSRAPSTVTFDMLAGTFLRDLIFAASDVTGVIRIDADGTFSNVTVRAVLERS